MENEWLYRFKRKIIAGLVLLLLLSTVLSTLYITLMTRNYLLRDSAANTRELGVSISSSLRSLMLRRSAEEIQSTISQLGKNEHIARILILNREGQIAYSSDDSENGRMLTVADESCQGCHNIPGKAPSSTTSILKRWDGDLQRNVTVIHNEPECFGCHTAGNHINGKLIIDCSLASTYSLIRNIRFVILASGALCLLVIFMAIPYLSRSIDRYIDQVVFKNNEISMIYSIIESVSRSIDVEDLKNITLDIVARTFSSDNVNIVLPMRDGHYRVVNRSRGGGEPHKVQEPAVMLAAAISRWQGGELLVQEMSMDRSTVYLPIAKGTTQLALIEIRSTANPFTEEKLKFMEAVSNPIAIAFENARLYSIAITDELTGLYTLRHFRSSLDRLRDLFDRHGDKFAMLLIDIDNFKLVNDTYGHPVGDQVLKQVSWNITEALRECDMAFRYGGEEFAVLLPNTGQTGGLHVGERIRSLVAEAITEVDGSQIKTTVSIGLAVFPENGTIVRDLVVEADRALYQAKRSGKNRVKRSEKVAWTELDEDAPTG